METTDNHFRICVDALEDSLCLVSKDGKVLFANEQLASRFGKTPETLVGMDAVELVPESVRARWPQVIAHLISTGKPIVTEVERSGRQIEVRFFPIANRDGDVTHLSISSRDLTDQRAAEKALRESEKRYRELVDNAGQGILISQDGMLKFANSAISQITGRSNEELLSKPFIEFVYKDDQEMVKNYYRERMQGGKVAPYSFRHQKKDGAIIWLEVSGVLVDWEGKPGSLNFMTEITARKLTETALAESEKKYRQIFEASRDGLMTLFPPDWHFASNNPAALELFGAKTDEELRSFRPWELSPEKQPDGRSSEEKARELIERALREGSCLFEWTHKKIDGEEFLASVLVNRVEHEKQPFLQSSVRDVTAARRTEAALHNIQKLESLGVLAGGIAHDFNNLLGGIFGFIDLAEATARDQKTEYYLSRAINTLDRARDLTRQLLTFSKGGAPVREVGPLFPFIEDTVKFALSGSDISCSFDVENALWQCEFDKNQIGQVIDNLVINAKQAMVSGGTLTVSARNASLSDASRGALPSGDYVKLSFRDTGVGIPEKALNKIFDPFFTTKTSGNGLGLATCYSIVNRHNGNLTVESQLGEGTTFHVFLPATARREANDPERNHIKHRGCGGFIVMDDEEAILEVITAMLTRMGYTVESYRDGRDVVERIADGAAKNRPLAGMILDLTVPGGVGGIETLKSLRKIDSSVPVFVASGYAEDPVMSAPHEFGFSASICKPFTNTELAGMLEKHLTKC